MRRFLPGSLLVVPLLSLALLAACGDDDDDDGGKTPSAQPTAAANTAVTPTRTAGGASGPLADLLGNLDSATYRGTYDVSSNAAGNITGTATLAGRPPARMFDFQGKTSLGINRFMVIETGSTSYLCLDAQGQKNCAKGEGLGGLPLPAGLSLQDLFSTIADATATEVQGRSVAGHDGRCFDVSAATASGTVCVTAEGVPLSFEGTFQGSRWTITATQIGTPTDADFTPPYTVVG